MTVVSHSVEDVAYVSSLLPEIELISDAELRTAVAAWPSPPSSMRAVRLTCMGAQNSGFLAGAEGNDAPHWIVG